MHFCPKVYQRALRDADSLKRGAKAGGDWPSIAELVPWMMKTEVYEAKYPSILPDQQAFDGKYEGDKSDGFDEVFLSLESSLERVVQ